MKTILFELSKQSRENLPPRIRMATFYAVLQINNGSSIAELYIPKTVDISANKMRELLVCNRFGSWKEFCNERLWKRLI